MRDLIEQEIASVIARHAQGAQTDWQDPLVRFASAQDRLFERLKDLIAPSHHTPRELLSSAQTVIAYFVPFDRRVARSNRHGEEASREWAVAYIETNQLIVAINQHLAHVLAEQGQDAVELPPTHTFDQEKLISDWSHKHVGYIAGLGTFGLHHMLITDKGCCGRLGSIVTSAWIEPTLRPVQEYCLYRHDRSCTACVTKCVGGALTESGLDRQKCYAVCLRNAKTHEKEGLADVCGKCISVVPCSFRKPLRQMH